jgi:hypothetical protein
MNCEPGMEIAKPLYTDFGTTLVGVGVRLTQRMIEGLMSRNVSLIYIKDKLTEDLIINDDIPMELRIQATNAINETFTEMQKANQKWNKSVDHLNITKLQSVFKTLLREIQTTKNAINLLSNVFVHDNYIFSIVRRGV